MDLQQVVEKFKSNPMYMQSGAGKLGRRFNCSREIIIRAREIVRSLPKDKKIEPVTKILILDVETSPMRSYTWSRWKQNIYLDQTISEWFMISWAAKWLYSTETMSAVLTPEEMLQENDGRIVKDLWKLLDDANIVIAHNGNSFDIPKIMSRCIVHQLPPPASYSQIDTKVVSAKQFGFSSNKLDALAGYFGIETKIDTNFDLWKRCMLGDSEALSYMEEYNRKDVEILEEVYLKMRPYIKGHPNVALFNNDAYTQCVSCGSSNINVIPDKLYYTSVGAYDMYRCNDCGAISRGRRTVISRNKNNHTLTAVGK